MSDGRSRVIVVRGGRAPATLFQAPPAFFQAPADNPGAVAAKP